MLTLRTTSKLSDFLTPTLRLTFSCLHPYILDGSLSPLNLHSCIKQHFHCTKSFQSLTLSSFHVLLWPSVLTEKGPNILGRIHDLKLTTSLIGGTPISSWGRLFDSLSIRVRNSDFVGFNDILLNLHRFNMLPSLLLT